jgi:hypothetical protein
MDNQTLFTLLKEKKEYNMARTLKKVTKQLRKASKLHANQAKIVANYVKKNEKKKRTKKGNRKKT